MNDFQRGFVVGLIDGEGTITLTAQLFKQRRAKHEKVYKYPALTITPKIIISNTNKDLIERVNTILGGGRIQMQKRRGRKPRYDVIIYRIEGVLSILKEVEPYLIVKKKQAEIVKRYCELRLGRMGGKVEQHKSVPYREEEFEMLKEIRLLNVPKAGRRQDFEEKINEWISTVKERYLRLRRHRSRVKRVCQWCNKEFLAHQYVVERGDGVYCSKKCNGKAWRAKQLGIPHEKARLKWC